MTRKSWLTLIVTTGAKMAWIESHTVLIRHRKLIELSRELRIRRSYTMGHLHALWHAAMEQQEDGDLSSWSDDMIAESSDFPGDASQWVQLLQKHRFLDGRILHDWLDYAGRYLESKYRTAKPGRMAEIRAKHSKSDFRQTKDSPPTIPNQPNHTLPNPPLAQSKCSAPDLASSKEVVRFPLPGKGETAVTDEQFPTWKQAYPGIDLVTELAKMRSWLIANPKKRKTAKGMNRFITSWLERAQDSYGGKYGKGAATPVQGKYAGLGEKA